MVWKYQEILNADIYIILAIGLGVIAYACKIFKETDLRAINTYVFKVLLPISVILGLGLKSDLTDGDIWRFVGAFLMLRALWLIICILFFGLVMKNDLGEVVANWMAITWISTIILGIPTLTAALGPQYAQLGVVAGISSFIFQLPVMLILYEVHVWRRDRSPDADLIKEEAGQVTAVDNNNDDDVVGTPTTALDKDSATMHNDDVTATYGMGSFRISKDQLKSVGHRLLNNYILWGLLIGLILSVSDIGPKWLNPGTPPVKPNCDYVVETGFIVALLSSFAACTEPTALFATGMFMARKNPIPCGAIKAVLYMIVKLILVPALMIGCAMAVGLDDTMARAAVLIAALPISAAASVLSKTYAVGDDITVANVFLGNMLILPTTLLWLEFMDSVDLFPATVTKAPDVCNLPAAPAGVAGAAAAPKTAP